MSAMTPHHLPYPRQVKWVYSHSSSDGGSISDAASVNFLISFHACFPRFQCELPRSSINFRTFTPTSALSQRDLEYAVSILYFQRMGVEHPGDKNAKRLRPTCSFFAAAAMRRQHKTGGMSARPSAGKQTERGLLYLPSRQESSSLPPVPPASIVARPVAFVYFYNFNQTPDFSLSPPPTPQP